MGAEGIVVERADGPDRSVSAAQAAERREPWRREEMATFLGEIERLMAALTRPEEMIGAIAPHLGSRLGLSRVAFASVDEAAGEVLAFVHEIAGPVDAWPGRQHFRLTSYLDVGLRRSLSLGVTAVVTDVTTDPRTADRADAYRRHATRSQVLVPHLRDGEWCFLLAAQRSDPHDWDEREVEVIRDLTMRICLRLERVRADQAIRESEDRYQVLFEMIDQAFCTIEMLFDDHGVPNDYRFIDMNPAFERHSGLHGVIGRRALEVAPNLEAHWFDFYGRVALTGTPAHVVNEAKDLDGRWFDVHAFRLGGGMSRRVAVLFDDITERRRTEEALRASEQRFRTLFERSADAVQLLTVEGRIVFSSDSVEGVLGYRPDEIEGHVITPYLHPDDQDQVLTAMTTIMAEPGDHTTLTYRARHRDGSWAWIETTLANHVDTPDVGVIVANLRNVTRRVDLERQKDDFLAVATHELKTPVTSLKGYAQVLRNRFRKAGDEASAGLMERMDRQLDKLTGLIADLLDVTRLNTGVLPLAADRFDLNDLVREIAGEVQLTSDRHEIRVEPAAEAMIVADRERTGQVLTNFLANAILYSTDSKDIVATVRTDADRISVTVRDWGIGIPAEQQARVFERFFRVHDVRGNTHPGLGLGLYISAEIVRRQGGDIWVVSAVGEGSTFGFWLPRGPGARASDEGRAGEVVGDG